MAHTLKDERFYKHGVTMLQRHGHPDLLLAEDITFLQCFQDDLGSLKQPQWRADVHRERRERIPPQMTGR